MSRVPGGTVRNDIVWSTEAGAEIAVTSVHMLYSQGWTDTAEPADVQTQTDECASIVKDALLQNWTNMGSHIYTKSHIVRVDSYALSAVSGKALTKATQAFSPVDLAGGSGSAALPPSTAMTLTLWAFPIGGWQPDPRRWKGRLFLPTLTTPALDPSTGLWSDTAMADVEQGWGAFFSQLAGAAGTAGSYQPVVLSRKDVTSRKIVAVTASKVPSVQRRRVNALAHTHGTGVAVS